jgi:hypothetical protein
MDPITLGLIAAGGSTLFQGVKGIQQTREAKEMQKNLGARVNYQIPEEAKRALALYQNMAVSRTMPGQQLMQNSIDMQQAKALGGATRAATSSQDLLGVMTNLGEQGMMQQQELGLAAAQNYTQRQQDYAGALGTMAGYQEKVNADKQQDWYERAAAAREMREAGLQNTMGAVQGLGQMGMMAAMGGFGGKDAVDAVRPSLSEGVEKISSIGPSQLPIGGRPNGLMNGSTISGRNVFFGSNNIPGNVGQLPVNQSGLMPTSSMIGRTFFQQTPNINSIQGQLPVNQSGLMPTTSIRDMLNMFNSYQSM